MGYQWVATELLTGVQICDLTDLVVQNNVADTIGRYEMATVTLPLPSAPPEWERATEIGATCYWLLADDPTGGQPLILWGGYVVTRQRDNTDSVTLNLTTLPGYFDSRWTGDRTYTNVGQNDIIADLITNCIAAGPDGGLPIRTQYVTAGSGKLRTHTWKDTDDKTVYSVLQEAMAWDGGPEWWVGGEWSGQLIKPVLYVGDRIGTAANGQPNVTFDMPGSLVAVSLVESYAQGKGANSVIATSTPSGNTRLQSPAQNVADPDRPTFEWRSSPSTSIEDVTTLTGYAQASLANMKNGSKALAMTAIADQTGSPVYGLDWLPGDDIGYAIGAAAQYQDRFYDSFTDNFGTFDTRGTVPAFPGGLVGVARVIGVQMTLGNTRTITPVLVGGDLVP